VVHRVMIAMIVILAATGLGGVMAAPADDEPVLSPPVPPATPGASPAPQAQQLPPEIAAVQPGAGSRVCRLPQIRVDLRLTDPMRPGGAFDPSTVSVRLDGRIITPEVRVLGTLIYPQARAYLVYKPSAPLPLGRHRAEITYPSVEGRRTFRWSFVVADIPCQ